MKKYFSPSLFPLLFLLSLSGLPGSGRSLALLQIYSVEFSVHLLMATLFPLNLIYNQIAQKYKTNSAHNNEANYLFINGEEINQETVCFSG